MKKKWAKEEAVVRIDAQGWKRAVILKEEASKITEAIDGTDGRKNA